LCISASRSVGWGVEEGGDEWDVGIVVEGRRSGRETASPRGPQERVGDRGISLDWLPDLKEVFKHVVC